MSFFDTAPMDILRLINSLALSMVDWEGAQRDIRGEVVAIAMRVHYIDRLTDDDRIEERAQELLENYLATICQGWDQAPSDEFRAYAEIQLNDVLFTPMFLVV